MNLVWNRGRVGQGPAFFYLPLKNANSLAKLGTYLRSFKSCQNVMDILKIADIHFIRRRFTMFLYLVQHVEAKREEDDPARYLTEKGRREIESVAHHLKRLHVQVRQIFHSDKTRAKAPPRSWQGIYSRRLESQKLLGWRRWMTLRSGRVGSPRWMKISCWWDISPIWAG